MKLLLAVENYWRSAVTHLRGREALGRLISVTSALDQCLAWLSAVSTRESSSEPRMPSDGEVQEFLLLGLQYVQLCTVFTAWHRGVAVEVLVDEEQRLLRATLPKRIAIYHAASMRFHDAVILPDAEEALRLNRASMLSKFSGDVSKIPLDSWRPAFEALYQIMAFDWDSEWLGDLGGFTMCDARRLAVTLRLWSELMIFSCSGLCMAQEKNLAGLLARYSGVSSSASAALVRDMAFDIENPGREAASYPLVRLNHGTLLTWSPAKVFGANHYRELLRRLSWRDRAIHDKLSNSKHDALVRRIQDLVAQYDTRLLFVPGVSLEDTDIDVVIIDMSTKTYLCLEVKALQSPRTLREAFDIDGRRSAGGRLNDGLLKGSAIQIPKILKHALNEPDNFLARIRAVAGDCHLPAPEHVLGAVISAWTFGTGEGDDFESPDLPHQESVRVVTLPLLRKVLSDSSGDLDLAYKAITRNEHLAAVTHQNQVVPYGDWAFEWQFA